MNVVDRIVEYFAPQAALRRLQARKQLERTALYAAAQQNRLTGSISSSSENFNSIIAASRPSITAQIRKLTRDFPYFASTINRLLDFTVGPGIIFQSKVSDQEGNLQTEKIKEIEKAFEIWNSEADISGTMSFYDMQSLAKRQEYETGEFLFVKRNSKNRNRYIPYCLQIYESDWLTDKNDNDKNIFQGIEYNPATFERIAYHFLDPESWYKAEVTRIPADQVIHGFEIRRPMQLRGISSFAPGILLARDLDSSVQANVDSFKMASKYLAFVTSDALAGRQFNLQNETSGTDTFYIDDMENAIIEYLNPGEKITIASNPKPGEGVIPFINLIVRIFAIISGAPYSLISGDYSQSNYSTEKAARNDFKKALEPPKHRLINQFCIPGVQPFFDQIALRGRVTMPGYFSDPWRYTRSEWQAPGMESNDPLREMKAYIDATEAGLYSEQEIIRMRGRDGEQVLDEKMQWKEWKKERGLDEPKPEISTAMANNPAKVQEQK